MFTPTALLQKLVEGGLKLMTGNVWLKEGVIAGVAVKTPLLPSGLGKKAPPTDPTDTTGAA